MLAFGTDWSKSCGSQGEKWGRNFVDSQVDSACSMLTTQTAGDAKSVKGRRVAFEILVQFPSKNFYNIVERGILQDSED